MSRTWISDNQPDVINAANSSQDVTIQPVLDCYARIERRKNGT